MNQFYDWLNMGGYAVYVWSAYGFVLTVLILNVASIKWHKTRVRQKLQRWFKR